jgi:hypothetical protein
VEINIESAYIDLVVENARLRAALDEARKFVAAHHNLNLVLVPRNPTEEMIANGGSLCDFSFVKGVIETQEQYKTDLEKAVRFNYKNGAEAEIRLGPALLRACGRWVSAASHEGMGSPFQRSFLRRLNSSGLIPDTRGFLGPRRFGARGSMPFKATRNDCLSFSTDQLGQAAKAVFNVFK